MFFTLNEIVQWIGLTVFEIWINLITITIFSVLLALKIDGVVYSAWWTVFAPLFVSDAMNAYFCCIVCIRMNLESSYKASLYRASWSAIFLGLTFVFKFLLCRKLQGDQQTKQTIYCFTEYNLKPKLFDLYGFDICATLRQLATNMPR